MEYLSTRGGANVRAAEAIVKGICPTGGLYVPAAFPAADLSAVVREAGNYHAIARRIMGPYLAETDAETLSRMVEAAYGPRFDHRAIAPTRPIARGESVLELWHGPTLAFKDMALQMLPHLMRNALDLTGIAETLYILVATSGDTGKAALMGFQDVAGTAVQVFYPHGGVSRAQELQMITQEGANVAVSAIRGNFDDAQTGVKRIFADPEIEAALLKKGYRLSSANSINFGRLLPQIAYYFAAYADACARREIEVGEKINFCVPTGNFGDILAGYYAMRMGLPVRRFLCASNRNNVLTDFFKTGTYDRRRPFYRSMSCSIDILISSNLERLLFEAAEREPARVAAWMQALSEGGSYSVGEAIRESLGALFYADCCDEADTLATIKHTFEERGYLMDPHTAVAETVLARYREAAGDGTHTVLLSTANPFKFASAVLSAFETPADDDFANARRLAARTGEPIPAAIAGLEEKPVRHNAVVDIEQMSARVLSAFD